MARPHIFSLVFCLCFGHGTAALAITPQQKMASKPFLTQRSTEALVVPPATTPKAAAGTSSAPVGQQATPPAQDELKKRRYIAEEMVMQRAWMYSAVVPGWGQGYNGDYWKVPAIYAVFAGLGWGAIYNHQAYMESKRKLIELTQQKRALHSLQNYVADCRRNRDLCIIFATLWYVANIFDAYVGASLKTFNLSDDISLAWQPSMAPGAQNMPTMGFSLTVSFEP